MTTVDVAGIEGARVALAPQELDDLGSRAGGRVLRPGDEGWDEASLVWNGMVARRPALVLQPISPAT